MEEATVTDQPDMTFSSLICQKEEMDVDSQNDEAQRSEEDIPVTINPVLTQPGPGIATTTITTVTQMGGDWSTGLLDVCGDMTTCIIGTLVPCYLDLSLAHQFGECLCMPLLPGSTFAIRVGIRERYKIRGSACEDWTAVYCCYPLAVCQMIREIKRRMKTQTYQVSIAIESLG